MFLLINEVKKELPVVGKVEGGGSKHDVGEMWHWLVGGNAETPVQGNGL